MKKQIAYLLSSGFLFAIVALQLNVFADDEEEDSPKFVLTQSMNDEDVSQAVRNAIANDPTIAQNLDNVYINTVNGEVTLSGIVTSDTIRTAIENKAKTIAGPYNVNNNIVVQYGSVYNT